MEGSYLRLGFLITARLKSTRCPLKILQDLNGKTVVERVIERTREVQGIAEIVLCTSATPQDRPLVDLAIRNQIYYFLGDEVDVLKRLLDAVTFFGMDSFLSITADNPLFSIYHANLAADRLKAKDCDYVKIEGLPIGAAVHGVKTKALQLVCQMKTMVDTEIWGLLFDQPEIFAVESIQVPETQFIPDDLRLTLDYPEDYRLINHIYCNVGFQSVINLENIFEYLAAHPELVEINRHCAQLKLDAGQINSVNEFFAKNKEAILKLKRRLYCDITC
jgi:spore coat polysaccharide biosynthesis protein SpsF